MASPKKPFEKYLKDAVEEAKRMAADRTDDDNLAAIHKACRKGALNNWKALTARDFLECYLWCTAGIRIRAGALGKKWHRILRLFRECKPLVVVRDQRKIKGEWRKDKLGLNEKKVNAFLTTATKVSKGWDAFKKRYLPEPPRPESEISDDWLYVFDALDQLPLVGEAVGWYLVRNIYGGPFFKPDTHIRCITHHYFTGNLNGGSSEPLAKSLCRQALPSASYWRG
jgi:hypothetical protein